MKILDLEIEGFRSLKSISWKPGDLNIVIGPNAGGKSNLLSALEMISASAQGKLAEFVKKQGGMQSLVWDGKAESVNFKINTHSLPKDDYVDSKDIDNSLAVSGNLTYYLEISRLGKAGSYSIEKECMSVNETNIIERDNSEAMIKADDGTQISWGIHEPIIGSRESTLFSATGFLAAGLSPSSMLNRSAMIIQQKLSSWTAYSQLDTGRDSVVRQAFVTSFDKQVERTGENFISVLHTYYTEDKNFKKEVDAAMRAAFGEDFEELSFPPAADGRSQMRIQWKSLSKPVSATFLSDGTLRFLYLLTILANPEPPALIAIDEPETGLHPSMMSIIAEYAVEAARKTQVVLTTHSPEFLGAFGDTRPTTTICELHDGQTELRVLAGDKLDYWLSDYSLGELYRTGQLENMK